MTSCIEDHMRESISHHEITSIHESLRTWPPATTKERIIKAYWLRRPPTFEPKAQQGYYSALIIFSVIGITIGGDIRIGNSTTINSVPGYGEDWFGGKLDEDYLCGKFNLDWSRRPAKSQRARTMKAACGWLCVVQQRFNVVYEALLGKGVVKA